MLKKDCLSASPWLQFAGLNCFSSTFPDLNNLATAAPQTGLCASGFCGFAGDICPCPDGEHSQRCTETQTSSHATSGFQADRRYEILDIHSPHTRAGRARRARKTFGVQRLSQRTYLWRGHRGGRHQGHRSFETSPLPRRLFRLPRTRDLSRRASGGL